MNAPNNWIKGLKRIPLHLLTFSPIGLAAHFVSCRFCIVISLCVWRGIAEYEDYVQGRDTLAKAVIDLLSQVAGSFVGALL